MFDNYTTEAQRSMWVLRKLPCPCKPNYSGRCRCDGLQGVSGANHTRLKTIRNLSFGFPLTLPCSFRVWSRNNYHHLDNTWAINHLSCCLFDVERKSVPRLIVRPIVMKSHWYMLLCVCVCVCERERERERERSRVSKRASEWEPFFNRAWFKKIDSIS